MAFDNRYFLAAADFADQFSESCANFTTHDWLTVLRDPDDVQVDAKDRVCAVPIFSHGSALYHAL